MAGDLAGRGKQEGAVCLHLGDEASWMSQYLSPFERGGSLYSEPLPDSGR